MNVATGLIRQGRRFAAVGVLNTFVGYAIIVAALSLGASDYVANALGYSAGLLLGFILHRGWSFGGKGEQGRRAAIRYGLAFGLAYSANIAVVSLGRRLGMIDLPVTHLVAMASYSLVFFLLARYYVFAGAETRRFADDVKEIAGIAAMTTAAAGYFAVVLLHPTTHDVVWQLWIGDRLHQGSRLYVDIMEINPPLWFWMAQVVSALGDFLRLESRTILIGAVVLWSFASAALTFRLTSDIPGARSFITTLCVIIAVYSFPYFGQREHLALLAAIPYAILVARRRSGAEAELLPAIVIGLLASAGFALKHYFVAIPILLELWFFVRKPVLTRHPWLRPETIALGSCAVGYAAAVLLWTPEFISAIIPMVRTAYASYEVDWVTAVIRPQLIFSVVAVVLALSIVRQLQVGGVQDGAWAGARKNLTLALALTGAGFALSFILQKKGWPYHGLPMTLASFSCLAAALLFGDRPLARLRRFPLAAGLLLNLAYAGLSGGGYVNPVRKSVEAMLADVPPGETVAALGSDPMIAWPMVAETGHRWPLRHYALWMLRALVENDASAHPDPELLQLAVRVREDTANDLACRPPYLILVDNAEQRLNLPKGSFDILQWLREDARFAQIFAHYEQTGSGDFGIRAFTLRTRPAPLQTAECRRL